MWGFLACVAVAAGLWTLWQVWRRRQRTARFREGLDPEARAIVAREVPLSRRLPEALRAGFEGRINLFLDQVDFVGCDGLEVTPEMRLSIAAQACLIVANSDFWYDDLAVILIYPGAFRSRQAEHDGFVVTEHETTRIGESWSRGQVVLSWQHVEESGADDTDGHNVVLHEFAHQIDGLSGDTDGLPPVADRAEADAWAEAFDTAYDAHLARVERGHAGLFDPYGAEGPEEFFAVALEAFFERADEMRRAEPALYRQFARLLRLDPAEWR
ncbi:zinc-dependent peptidase [Roseovarius sp. SCSIO 43702]|uniref:M90 family metallopeptidase n=1 Tax=Roseovarius sp. SCSIO 43702 TaxID=2823043 RepID=UPI001C72FE2C|nr:M90 family metallopeptidase [Roseovarius sp. SCSIO 43702]QYX56609.1 zinc-dependent peptidase [Roseovarius sp. SCSIO 43702]